MFFWMFVGTFLVELTLSIDDEFSALFWMSFWAGFITTIIYFTFIFDMFILTVISVLAKSGLIIFTDRRILHSHFILQVLPVRMVLCALITSLSLITRVTSLKSGFFLRPLWFYRCSLGCKRFSLWPSKKIIFVTNWGERVMVS